jgi:hypothetical protein
MSGAVQAPGAEAESAPPGATARLAHGAVAALAGLVFGIGLVIAGMTDPRKVLAFLDVAGDWDPSLVFVLGAAVIVAGVGFRVVFRRGRPVLGDRFHLSTRRGVDRSLVLGSAIFGVGWGIAGFCPGPAIGALGFASVQALWFVPALLLGAGLHRWQARRRPVPPREA